GILWILCGMIFIVMGMGKMIVSLLTLFLPKGERELVNILYQKRYLERGPKIVVIGGGHGLSHLIFGLKEYTANITAIVTVADSGGSSGRLREEFNIVAPGDIRNCLVALADAPALMGELFQFRFSKDSQLQGHNFGNLFLTAMVQLTNGDFERAVKETSKVLAIRGNVVPSTVSNVHLVAEYMDGTITQGEARIPNPNSRVKRVYLTDEAAYPTAELIEHANKDVIDACLINNVQAPEEARNRYKDEGSFPVEADADKIRAMGYRVVATDLLGVTDYVRHDSTKLNHALIKLVETHRVIRR
ncbi:MAG: YvcK family protein, partial [Candidatus Omnitrophica bacterium]|nr:YvcK family protein [Candidatus Omnitrophota bacterium]